MITYELVPAGNATVLTLTQEGFSSEEAYEHSNVNWDQVLQGMKKLLEQPR